MSVTYSAKKLLQVAQWVKEHPDGEIKVDWYTTLTSQQWKDWFMECLHAKINRTLPQATGRKHTRAYYWDMYRAARDLNTPRLAIHWLPKDLRARFAHRLRND